MDFLQILAAAIVLGSTLGTTVASLFAYRQKSLVTMLRESNKDYKDRVEQLEQERDELKKTITQMQRDIEIIKSQKAAPLEKLTKLVIQQNAQTNESILRLTTAIENQQNGVSK